MAESSRGKLEDSCASEPATVLSLRDSVALAEPHSTACASMQNTHSTTAHAVGNTNEERDSKNGPSQLEQEVRKIQRENTCAQERLNRIHALFAERRARVSTVSKKPMCKVGMFPGEGAARGCSHYQRNCWIKAACCGKYYPCRRCHDEHEDHEIDRHATQIIACVVCGDDTQPVAECCRTCGIRFARYFCKPCRFFDDSPDKSAYHCEYCGICRVGKGLGKDNIHCSACNMCVPIEAKHSHPCRERNLDSNCPICGQYLATSTDQTIFLLCSHPMHVNCLKKHMERSYTCPVCSKCIPEREKMEEWYRQIDKRLEKHVMPEEYANRVSRILCNDCGEKTTARFHFQFHKCGNCNGYNTRVLAHFDVAPHELPPRSEASGVEPSTDAAMQDSSAGLGSQSEWPAQSVANNPMEGGPSARPTDSFATSDSLPGPGTGVETRQPFGS